jgi:hypothetical protein
MSDTDRTSQPKAELASEKESQSHYDSRNSKDEKLKVDARGQPTEEEETQHNWGRLVVDPEEAKIEFGEERTAKLKKTPDGKWILWPQP